MKRLSSVYTEMLDQDVKRFVKEFNSMDYETVLQLEDIPSNIRKVVATAIYICGWRYIPETLKYEREENDA